MTYRKRRKELGVREAGVGAESPPPSPKHELAMMSAKQLDDEKNLNEGKKKALTTGDRTNLAVGRIGKK
jgi:hypothetical protein